MLRPLAGIALNTFREALRQPVTIVVVALSAFLLWLSKSFTLFGLGRELNMLRETGLASVRLAGILLVVFLGCGQVAVEAETRSLTTVLARPVRRRDVLLGRYLGTLAAIALSTAILSAVLALVLIAREGAIDAPQALSIGGGIALAFLQVAVLLAVALLWAPSLPFPASTLLTLVTLALGHLGGYLASHLEDAPAPVRFAWDVVRAVVPDLQAFNVASLVAAGRAVPADYFALTSLYGIVYIVFVMTLAVAVFERREIA